jgi:hypothetical protein
MAASRQTDRPARPVAIERKVSKNRWMKPHLTAWADSAFLRLLGSRTKVLEILLVLACGLAGAAHAQEAAPGEPPRAAANAAPGLAAPLELNVYGTRWRAKGTGALRFFGFKAYDAILWLPESAAGVFSFSRAFALDIRYSTSVKASDITNTSLIEMARISGATAEQVQDWTAFMTNLFVDVKSGDRLVGVYVPTAGARFFLNGRLIGETTDAAFSEAFFKIWLDPKTRRPELRSALLGL